MNEDDALSELWRIKEEIGNGYASARELAVAVNHLAKNDPLPLAGKSRKMIENFPKGQSVADEDNVMKELRTAKEAIAVGDDDCLNKNAEAAPAFSRNHPAHPPVKSQKLPGKAMPSKNHSMNAPSFRSESSKSASKHRANGKH